MSVAAARGNGSAFPPLLRTAGPTTRFWNCVTIAWVIRVGHSRRRWTAARSATLMRPAFSGADRIFVAAAASCTA